jgi:hypothetical protein
MLSYLFKYYVQTRRSEDASSPRLVARSQELKQVGGTVTAIHREQLKGLGTDDRPST